MLKTGGASGYRKSTSRISLFMFLLLGYFAVVHYAELNRSYLHDLFHNVVMAAITLVFYFTEFRSINRLLRFKPLRWSLLLRILILAPILAVVVSIVADLLNRNLLDESYIGYYYLLDSPAPVFFSLLSVAVFPAIFEEIAFRGVVFNYLMRLTRIKATIVISAILFTIIHLSVVSVLWLFPIGLIFGYFRARYRTLWYGIIGHFVYNASIVAIDIIVVTYWS